MQTLAIACFYTASSLKSQRCEKTSNWCKIAIISLSNSMALTYLIDMWIYIRATLTYIWFYIMQILNFETKQIMTAVFASYFITLKFCLGIFVYLKNILNMHFHAKIRKYAQNNSSLYEFSRQNSTRIFAQKQSKNCCKKNTL